ncbi:hypothetical protein LTS10_012026 [Elasticomyces elasticus]|nr:hypothetical protein LTS10_012026 [Elasticomyces elasticus]
MIASLRFSKYIYKVVKEAYFTQRRFSLRLEGRYPPNSLRPPNLQSFDLTGRMCIRTSTAPPILFPHPSPLKSSHGLGLLSEFAGGSFADRAIHYDNVRNLTVIITPTELTDALTLVSHLVPVLERCQKVASMDVLFTQARVHNVIRGGREARETIMAMVAQYGKRFNTTTESEETRL